MLDLDVIDEPAVAAAALDPVRSRILAALAEPGSAASIADELGLPRQNVNYHLRALEDHGLVEFVEHRPKRGLKERVVQATARSYVVAPPSLGADHGDPQCVDRLSSRYLVAVAARLVREVADLARRAEAAKRPLATLTIGTEIRFRSAAERAAFTDDLARAVTALASHYHDERSGGGRWFRLVVAAHPTTKEVSQ